MYVSFRNILAVSGAAILLTGAGAFAQSGAGHVINAPTINVGGAGATGDASDCCTPGPRNHAVNVPGVRVPGANITVGGVNTTLGANTTTMGVNTVYGGASSSGVLFFNDSALPVGEVYASTVLEGLDVAGGEEYVTKTVTEQRPAMEEVCLPASSAGPRPIQAVCVDDKGAPHPASQTFPEEAVAASQKGEIFRCMAGTSMQITFGGYDETGRISFNNGRTMSCAKGEALVHANGDVSCQRQEPRRNCNERSLLRRHGPGVKILQASSACVPTTRTVMKTVSKEVTVKKPSAAGGLVLDGGVGQGVY